MHSPQSSVSCLPTNQAQSCSAANSSHSAHLGHRAHLIPFRLARCCHDLNIPVLNTHTHVHGMPREAVDAKQNRENKNKTGNKTGKTLKPSVNLFLFAWDSWKGCLDFSTKQELLTQSQRCQSSLQHRQAARTRSGAHTGPPNVLHWYQQPPHQVTAFQVALLLQRAAIHYFFYNINYQFYHSAIFVHSKSVDFSSIIWALKTIAPVPKIKCKLSHTPLSTLCILHFLFSSSLETIRMADTFKIFHSFLNPFASHFCQMGKL